ncbi:colicin-K [Escherichia coli H252]|nr:colicin-K [Escherichia coli H252]
MVNLEYGYSNTCINDININNKGVLSLSLNIKIRIHGISDSGKLAEKSKGKKIQGVDEALAAFEKYKNVLDKKFSKVDRDAIFNALESVNYDELSKNLTKISKYA